MARRFSPAADYRRLQREVDRAVTEAVDEVDEDALVYVSLSGMGRGVHVIVVSDPLDRKLNGQRDEWLWDELERRLSEDALETISLLQVINVEEALRMHGPVDVERLRDIGARLAREWDKHRDLLGRITPDGNDRIHFPEELEPLLRETVDWAQTSELVARTAEVRRLAKRSWELMEMTLQLRADAERLLRGPNVVRELPDDVNAVVRTLSGLSTAAAA